MDQNIRNSIQTSTFFYFLIISSLTTVSQLATMMVIIFGDISEKQLLVSVTVFVSGFTGAFGVFRVLTNFKLIIDEMDDDIAATRWGQEIQAIPISALRFIFSGFFLVVAVIQLITIYS